MGKIEIRTLPVRLVDRVPDLYNASTSARRALGHQRYRWLLSAAIAPTGKAAILLERDCRVTVKTPVLGSHLPGSVSESPWRVDKNRSVFAR
jgi:hypothetical protein